jgi:hypothetical protein
MRKKSLFLMCLGFAVVALTSTAALAMNIDVRIVNGNDDVEEYTAAKNMYLTSTDLEMPYEDDGAPPTDEQVIGLRWTVPLPKGSTILKAYVEFTCDDPKGGTNPVNLIIEGQLMANAPAFTAATANLTGRAPWTKTQVPWAVANWTAAGQKSQTPDISAILQEIVEQPGWVDGSTLVLAFRDDKSTPSTGIRSAVAYEGGFSQSPLLHIEVFNPAAYAPNPADGTIGVVLSLLKWARGDGALFHNVYLGRTPDLTETDLVVSKRPETSYYKAGLEPGGMYYWRVDEVDAAGTVTPGFVWSFVMQAVTAYYPTPANGAVDATPATVLTWKPGRGAIKHHMYFGDSLDAVTQGTTAADKGEILEATFAPPALDGVTTYYWRVDEIGVGDVVKTGSVWSFTTCILVDDFESYTDEVGSRIFQTWIDGWGYTEPPPGDPGNGTNATVGYSAPPFADITVVHGGKQSMPLDYNNVNAPWYSETQREFETAENWQAGDANDLVLYIRGMTANTPASLYVAVEDASRRVAVVAHPDPAVVSALTWVRWKIPLSRFTGVNLAAVKKLCIGVGDRNAPTAGGAGKLYIDDIVVVVPAPAGP